MPKATCSIEGCTRPAKTRGWCGTHYIYFWKRGQHIRGPLAAGYHLSGSQHGQWTGDEVGYAGAHDRVHKMRGSAKAHPCARDCGRAAVEWAYDRAAPDERVDEAGRPYSPDPQHYLALCKRCHWELDHPNGKPHSRGIPR